MNNFSFCRESRKWLLVSAQVGLHSEYKEVMFEVAASEKRFLIMEKCTEGKNWDFKKRCQGTVEYTYPDILQVLEERERERELNFMYSLTYM